MMVVSRTGFTFQLLTAVIFLSFVTICESTDVNADKKMNKHAKNHTEARPPSFYLHHIFHKYGNGEKISFEGFERLINSLGLGKIDPKDSHKEDHDHTDHDHAHHEHDHADHDHSNHDHNLPNNKTNLTCLRPQDLLPEDDSLTHNNFLQVCPTIISQLDSGACNVENDEGHHHDNKDPASSATSSWRVWVFSLISILIISLVGLVCVAVVPLLHKVAYNHLQQFLVTLAVGSLLGDALLHLLPHALLPHHEETSGGHDENHHANHQRSVFLGLVALSGLYLFFLVERLMAIITKKKQRETAEKRKKKSPEKKCFLQMEAVERCAIARQVTEGASCDQGLMVIHPSKDVRTIADGMHDEIHEECDNTDHQHRTHVQIESHGHSHNVGDGSIASVAWMVIMGDGLHNFCDGIAIGVAFASSISGGISTSIAVFCHELPHELGDFAMLLRAGMSVKQALMYNMVSSILCLVGMVIGVVLGDVSAASPWIFCVTAGMFIYIALVDMLPEVTLLNPHKGENPGWHLLLQNIGLLMGAAIMLSIALFEDQIKVDAVL